MLLLPIASFAVLWVLVAAHRNGMGFGNLSIRGAFVLAYLAFELLVLAITEVTSVGHHLTSWSVAGCWLLIVVSLLIAARSPIVQLVRRTRSGPTDELRLRTLLPHMDIDDWIWIAIVVLIMGALVVDGSLYRPANGDSMVYHLARVSHWVQNRSIAPYATHYLAQVELSPLSEYNLAQLHLLSGTDRFDWTMQWFAAVVCIVGTSELARLFGASRSVQIAASVICAAIPSGILLSVTTENDFFAAAMGMGLLVVLAVFSFGGHWVVRTMVLGVTAGLAYLAKGTLPSMIGPAALALFALAIYRWVRASGSITWGKVVRWAAVAGATVAAVAGPFAVQTWFLFGSVVGPVSKKTVDSQITFSGFGANLVRSTAGNFDIGNGVSGLSTYTSMAVLGVLRRLFPLFGVAPSDSRFAFNNLNFDPLASRNYVVYEHLSDYGANPWHVLLALASLVILAVGVVRGQRSLWVPLLVGLTLSLGYILFSGIARWSPFEVRYAMPLLVVWPAVIAVALNRTSPWITRAVLVFLVVACLPELLNAAERPLVGPIDYRGSHLAGYFPGDQTRSGNALASDYQTATAILSESTCNRAALGNWVLVEYPLWVGLQHDRWNGLLNDFDVHNQTTSLEPSYHPCAWITQQGPNYITPNNETVNAQLGHLALSLKPGDVATVRTPVPRFESHIAGSQLLPGGGWAMAAFGNLPFLASTGSLYVVSSIARREKIEFNLLPGFRPPTLSVSGPDGPSTVAHLSSRTYTAEIEIHRGVNRIGLSAVDIPKIPKEKVRLVLLESVVLVPAGG